MIISRTEFENILREHGHPGILQRRVDANESGPYREVAGGRYSTTAERWTVWRTFPGSNTSKGLGDTIKAEGIVDGSAAIFYIQAEAMPKTGDLFSEETPNERYDSQIYRVETAVPNYNRGEVIFFTMYCRRLDPIH